MALSQQRRKDLRTIGHDLNPIVTVAGNGLSDNVLAELERALEDHELIKVKLAIGDREARKALSDQLLESTKSECIQAIGKVILTSVRGNFC
jgi:RNA-binding protein